MTGPLLVLDGLTVSFSGAALPAVDNVSFSLRQGESLGIIGESGAGKSTLATAACGLLESGARVDGRSAFDGVDLVAATEKQRCSVLGSEIGFIFQDPVASLDPTMRIVDQVAEPLCRSRGVGRREARRRAHEKLGSVGIGEELLQRAPYAHQLSGGMCQRAMIAAALAAGPRLLVADEPTSSLDVVTQAQIACLIKKMQRRSGLAMIFISHDLSLVSRLVDQVAVMHAGRLVETGNCRRVLLEPSHEYTRSLIDCWGRPDGQGVRLAPA